MMRALARNVAKIKMKRAGYVKLCKPDGSGRSPFAKLWRQYA